MKVPSYIKPALLILAALCISGFKAFAVDPIVTVRFTNPEFVCSTQTYSLDVEFQCNTANKELFGMNVRFFYPDNVLEFLSFGEFASGYGSVAPNPPIISTGNSSSGMTLFTFPGPQEYVNGAIQKNTSTTIYLPTTTWVKLFNVNFHVDDPSLLGGDSFCQPVIWDLNEAQTGGINPSGGIIITLVLSYPVTTSPATEHCQQFNWQYDGVPGLPHGFPNPITCISTICSYAPHTILPSYGVLDPGAITLPVKVTNFSSIGAFNLIFEYDSTTMSYVSNTPNPVFNATNGLMTVTNLASTGGKKKITMSFDGNFISLADSAHLADFCFNYASGSTPLTWKTDGTSCEYIGQYNIPAYDLPFTTYYFNGTVSSTDAPVTRIDSLFAYTGEYITFNVRTWNYINIHAGSLTLNYDPAVLVFNGALPNAAIASAFTAQAAVPGTLTMTWVGADTSLVNGSTLSYLTFHYLGGTSSLSWFDNGLSCNYVKCGLLWNLNDTPCSNHYFNGRAASAVLLWTGENSENWETGTNWNGDVAPGPQADVVIDPSTNPDNWPEFVGDFTVGEECNNLKLNSNAHMTITGDFIIEPGHTLNLNGNGIIEVYGNWINSGSFIPGLGTIEFTGTQDAFIDEGVPPGNYIAGYNRSTFAAGMTAISGGTAGPTGDNAHLDASIGFNFSYLGTSYSQVRINTNGWLSLNLSGPDATSTDNLSLFNINTPTTTLAPWWDDLKADGTTTIKYLTSGTTPSRIFTVEWKNILAYNALATARLNFQVKLYEGTNVIEFCYGTVTSGSHNTNEGASIGVKDAVGGTGNFIEATQNSSTIIMALLKSTTNWPAVNYRFTPPVSNPQETFYKIIVTKSGGKLYFQRDVKITGI
jgi:hypothetical protein